MCAKFQGCHSNLITCVYNRKRQCICCMYYAVCASALLHVHTVHVLMGYTVCKVYFHKHSLTWQLLKTWPHTYYVYLHVVHIMCKCCPLMTNKCDNVVKAGEWELHAHFVCTCMYELCMHSCMYVGISICTMYM